MIISIRENSFFARLAARKLRASQVAMVLGKTIHLYGCSRQDFLSDRSWVCHELKHIQQFQRYGRIRFILLYLLETIRHGYNNNKFEKEAREAARDSSLLKEARFT